MIKHFCDLCHREISDTEFTYHMYINSNEERGLDPDFDVYYIREICEDCRKNLETHLKCLALRTAKRKGGKK